MIALFDLTDLTNSMDSDCQISGGQQVSSSYNPLITERTGKQQLKSVNFVDASRSCQ
jgi:hypothetical protein